MKRLTNDDQLKNVIQWYRLTFSAGSICFPPPDRRR